MRKKHFLFIILGSLLGSLFLGTLLFLSKEIYAKQESEQLWPEVETPESSNKPLPEEGGV